MRAVGSLNFAGLVFAGVFALALSLLSCSGRGPSGIQHTIIIFRENHTFDNYFGTFRGADGVTSGATSTGQPVPLTPLPDMDFTPHCNSWDCALEAMKVEK